MDSLQIPDALKYIIRSYLPPHPLSHVMREAIMWIHKQRNSGKTKLTDDEKSSLYYDEYYFRCCTTGVLDKSKFRELKKFHLLNRMFGNITLSYII